MSVDETREIPITFPKDYVQEDLAGRSTLFTVTVKDIKAKELPDLDDDFAQAVSESTVQLWLSYVNFWKNSTNNRAPGIKRTPILKQALIEKPCLENCEVDPPETLVNNEVDFLVRESAIHLQSQGIDINKLVTKDTLPQVRERLRPDAVTRVKRTLALAEVAQAESITVAPDALDKRVQEVSSELGDRKVDQERLRDFLEDELLQTEVVKWLKDHAQIELVDAKSAPEDASIEAEVASVATAVTDAPVVDVPAEEVTEADIAPEAAEPSQTDTPSSTSGDSTVANDDTSSQKKSTAAPPKAKSTKTAPKAKTSKAESKTSKTAAKTSKTAAKTSKTKVSKTTKAPKKSTVDGTQDNPA